MILSNSHVIRAMNEQSYETIEVTGPQMVMVMKLITFAWNVYDSRRPSEVSKHFLRSSVYPSSLVVEILVMLILLCDDV